MATQPTPRDLAQRDLSVEWVDAVRTTLERLTEQVDEMRAQSARCAQSVNQLISSLELRQTQALNNATAQQAQALNIAVAHQAEVLNNSVQELYRELNEFRAAYNTWKTDTASQLSALSVKASAWGIASGAIAAIVLFLLSLFGANK